jgi:hypothetical protein
MPKAIIEAAIKGNPASFKGAVGECGVAVNQLEKNALKSVAGAIAGAFTIGAIKAFATEALRTADEIDNLTKIVGMSAEAVQTLQKVTDDSGLSFEKLQAGIVKMTKSQTEANSGNEKMIASFRALGISQEALKTMNTEQLFTALTEAMAENQDNAEAMAETYDILGSRSAGELKAMLVQLGSDGLDTTTEKLKAMGRVIDNETIKTLDAMEQRIKNAGEAAKTFGMKILASVIDNVQRFGASLGHLSAGDLEGAADALGEADYWTKTYAEENKKAAATVNTMSDALEEAAAATDAVSESMSAGAKETDASKERIAELLGEIESLNDQLDDAKQTEVSFKIEHMTRSDLAIWQEFFANFQGADTDYKVDVQLQHITQHQLSLWEKFLNMIRYADTKVNIKVDLPGLTNKKLSLYEKLFEMVKGTPSFEIKIPKLDSKQLKYYAEFMKTIAGGAAFELKLPDKFPNGVPVDVSPLEIIPFASIAESLKTIASLKGVLFA